MKTQEKEAEPLGCVGHIVEESFSQEKTEIVPANLKDLLCNVIFGSDKNLLLLRDLACAETYTFGACHSLP